MKRRFLAFLAFAAASLCCFAQGTQQIYWNYVNRYSDMAVDQMQRYGIPASITLAQGLCESGAGQSRLATEAHNHFGIKVGTGWTGKYIVIADDRPDDRFRVYRTDDESYEDHSRFLSRQPRYRSLFSLSHTDYRGWAHGLKRCGYATNPRYAEMLIGVIERYNLTQFDSRTSGRYHAHTSTQAEAEAESSFFAEHIVYKNNGCYMIVANVGDTWENVARETGTKPWRLLQYNDLPADYQMRTGDVVYLQKKKRKADRQFRHQPHTVQPGESMYSISQRYGIRLASLYKMNKLNTDYEPQVGDLLRVR